MKEPKYSDNVFYHQTSSDYRKSSNAALLICAFQVKYLLYRLSIMVKKQIKHGNHSLNTNLNLLEMQVMEVALMNVQS